MFDERRSEALPYDAQAERRRRARHRSMLPGSQRDSFAAVAKIAFPLAAAALFVVLIALPLSATQEFSFLLSKANAAKAGERMRIQEATYRGETARGEPFSINAISGVQKLSSVPVVILTGLSAEIQQAAGPATVTAPSGEFLLEENRILINGPVEARSASGYSLDGSSISVDIEASRVSSAEPVSGTLPMGTFRSDRFAADIDGRNVRLDGGVKLRITPRRGA